MTGYVRTTIKLREDVYQTLKKEAGAKNMSEKINELLMKMLYNMTIGYFKFQEK